MLFLEKFEIENALLVFPKFPIARNPVIKHHELPIGLLKIGSYLKQEGVNVCIVNQSLKQEIPSGFSPDIILVSTLFTYYAPYVKKTIDDLRVKYPTIPLICGGIWASLAPDVCQEYTGCDYVHHGIIPEAEDVILDYSLLQNRVNFQIVHTSRGCSRHCQYCGCYHIEPEHYCNNSIKKQIRRKHIYFYDNNLLANPHISVILDECIQLHKRHMVSDFIATQGFEKALVCKNPDLIEKCKQANFIRPYFAWDEPYTSRKLIKKTIKTFIDSGYNPKHIGVYMLFNHDVPFEECEKKRIYLYKLGVRIADCRFRPYTQLYDNFNMKKKNQTSDDYYIHPKWTDDLVKAFRRNCGYHTRCLYNDLPFYTKQLQRKNRIFDYQDIRNMSYNEALQVIDDVWHPLKINGGWSYKTDN